MIPFRSSFAFGAALVFVVVEEGLAIFQLAKGLPMWIIASAILFGSVAVVHIIYKKFITDFNESVITKRIVRFLRVDNKV